MFVMSILFAQLATAVPTPVPPPAPAVPAVSDANPAHILLAELETATDGLVTVTADVHHEIIDALLEEKVIRKGSLLYRIDPEDATRALAFAFEREIRGGRAFDDRVRYVVKHRWLVEVDPDDKIFIKRAIAGPGEDFDPLALGEGVFPLPIGQPAARVLQRFDASLVSLPTEGPLARLRGDTPIDGIRLVPRPGTSEAEDMQRIDVFYDRATRLPIGVHVIETNEDEQIARLTNVVRNGDISADRLAWLDIEPPDPREWSIDIR